MTRERDELGRPLAEGRAGVAGPMSRPGRTPDETLREAQHWLDLGRPFAAHEIFEDAWKNCADGERALWQGLAQVAVALTHARRGNARGVTALTKRARESLRPFAFHPPYKIDVPALIAWTELAEASVATDPAAIARLPDPPRLRR